MQANQFADQHQADSASRHFLINGIAAPEKPSAQIFPLPGGNSDPRITYLYAPCILFSVGTNMDIINPEKPDVPLNKNDAFQKVQKRRVQEKR